MSFLSDIVEGMFFRSNSMQYWSAPLYGLNSVKQRTESEDSAQDDVYFEILLPDEQTSVKHPDIFVFYFHSAQFNLSYNMQQVAFLAQSGIPVVMFDYRGCGESSGTLSLAGSEADAETVWQKLDGFDFLKGKKAVLFGQGVGADIALRFYKNHASEISGVILESVYAAQKGWIQERYGPVVGDVLAKVFHETEVQPLEVLPSISCPLLIIRPERDDFVRKKQQALVQAVLPKHAEVQTIKNAKYLGVFSDNHAPYRRELLEKLSEWFAPSGRRG